MSRAFDAIIVGAGQAGPPLAARLTAAGMSVALIERHLVGGTCVNTGCTLAGPLRLSAPVSFGALHLGPALYPFLAANPGIDLILDLDDRFVDAAADGYDAVLRHGPLRDNRLIAKRLASSRRLLVASPAYLASSGSPRCLDDLAAHRAILYANREADWRFRGPAGETVIRPRAALRVNNGVIMRDAALAGLGITLLPTFLIHQHLIWGHLEAIDVGCHAGGADLYLAYPSNRSPSAKVIALADCLRDAFGDPPYWDALSSRCLEDSARDLEVHGHRIRRVSMGIALGPVRSSDTTPP